ncbi:hypothetical protein Vadar_016275 [Vaccinium darrowii]|uniref:Uncharacterized protein n=1 Tax=Vaccinium darrowii TaxID=229202 RepID=A0ACB7ZC78_9ERIC|nr:hypothetical protein Vadar_016275 [Vaccinium darrowii]
MVSLPLHHCRYHHRNAIRYRYLKPGEEERVEGGVEVVKPKPKKGITSKAIDWLEKLIVKVMYDSSSQPHHYLSGNFAPVPETPPCKDLPVKGHLPECLNGVFVRVGPNPKFGPVAGYHWFDGDGMIHGLRIKDGKASYVSRYVKTSRLKQEESFGGAKFMKVARVSLGWLLPVASFFSLSFASAGSVWIVLYVKIGDLKGLFGLLMVTMQTLRAKLKVLDLSYGHGTDVIKILEDGDLQTLGLLDYDERLAHSFTAHPKVDPFTGEMFTFGNSYTPPYITYRVISKDGLMQDPVLITISDPIMMHDFAITENYAIIMDLPYYFQPKEMAKGNKTVFTFDANKTARFGILPRYAKDELLIKWFELPSCFIFHNANSWEEGDEVVLISYRNANLDLEMISGKVKEKFENFTVELYEMRFNMKTGLASQKKLSVSAVDFPRVNESYIGRKQQFVYGALLGSTMKVSKIIKFDLHAEPESGKAELEVGGNVQGMFDLGPGRFGSEAVFVPRKLGITSEEDDGYLIFFVHDEASGKSEVNLIDAKTMSADPVAVVELPTRVPYGFHALFVTEPLPMALRRPPLTIS